MAIGARAKNRVTADGLPLTFKIMQKTIPAHLASTYQLIWCAFPQGIDDQRYLALLSILYKNMSDRSLAQVVAEYTGKDYHFVLNDVYRVGWTRIHESIHHDCSMV